MPRDLSKIGIIAYYTFKEIIKSKILLNVLFLGLGLMLVTFVAFNFTFGEAARVALDFGFGTLSLSSVGMAIFIGVGLLSREIESRTVYMIISRPVPRYTFILGKLLGLIGVLVINILLLSLLTLSLYFVIGGDFQSLILWCILFTILEAILVLLTISVLSLMTSSTIAVLFTLMLYISGHALGETKKVLLTQKSPVLDQLLDLYHFVLPAFYKLNLKDYLIYKQSLPWNYLLSSMSYGICYSIFLAVLAIFIFERKNID